MNGHKLSGSLLSGSALRPASGFTEDSFKAVRSQVENLVRQSGGNNMLIVDPMVLLTLGLVLDRLAKMEKKLELMAHPLVAVTGVVDAEKT